MLTDDQKKSIASEALENGRAATSGKYGVPGSSIYDWQIKYGLRPWQTPVPFRPIDNLLKAPKPDESDEREYSSDGYTINLKSRTVQTYEQLVEHCKVDLTIWEPVSFKVKTYQMGYVPRATGNPKDGWERKTSEPGVVQLYGITASFRKKVPVIAAREEIKALIEDAKDQIGPYATHLIQTYPQNSGYLLELCFPDLHSGRLSWGRETGGDDYDLGLSIEVLYKAFETLIDRSSQYSFDRVLFVVGQDALNADSNEGTTTKGTRQDVDSRHFKVFQAVRQAHVNIIERCIAEIAPTHAVIIPGNHDELSCLHLGDSLECRFWGNPNVTVDTDPKSRKYVEWGKVMLGLTHGDKGKAVQWAHLMAAEEPAMWARTVFREVHSAHLHRDMALKDEFNGVKVRVLSSLAAPDAWHAQNGYTANLRSAECFHWHKDEGLVGTALFTQA